jgi:hypothetical protein
MLAHLQTGSAAACNNLYTSEPNKLTTKNNSSNINTCHTIAKMLYRTFPKTHISTHRQGRYATSQNAFDKICDVNQTKHKHLRP